MNRIICYGLQAFNYLLFIAVVWYFSIMPPYHQLEGDEAVITLSFTHATKIREACRKLSQEELMKLAPNMRLSTSCPRERSPLNIELYLDEKLVNKEVLEPLSIHKDQGVSFFKQIKVKAGQHELRVWMNDDVNIDGPIYVYKEKISLKPEQLLLLDFDSGKKKFFLK